MDANTPISADAPKVGERFPDVSLPDQSGKTVDLQAARGSRRALVIFYRSARW